MPTIFVYGTLKRGFHNNYLLERHNAVLVNPEKEVLGFQLWELGIPYMVQTNNPFDTVTGEVWEVTEDCLEDLDRLEGHPDWYCREPVSGQLEAYTLQQNQLPQRAVLNQTGVYRNHD